MAPVGFAVLGCGGIGRWHARQLQTLPGARLVAMADPSEAARERAAREFAVPVVASADEILARQDVEAVTICTPPATHTGLAHAAAAAGKHVLVEKPLALTAAEAETLVAACASSNVHLGVVHQQRAQAACQAAKRLIEEGRLGTLVYAVGSLCWHRPDAVRAGHAWRGSDRGGGLLLDAGVHLVDLLLWFLGPAGWVTAEGAHGGSRLPEHATVSALIGFASGATAAVALSFTGNLFRDDLTLEIVGTRGACRLEIRDHDHAELVRVGLAESDDKRARHLPAAEVEDLLRAAGGGWRAGPRSPLWRSVARLLPGERGSRPFASPISYLQRTVDRRAQREMNLPQAHAAVLGRMAEAVRQGTAPLVTGSEACAGLTLIEAMLTSAAEGERRVSLGTAG